MKRRCFPLKGDHNLLTPDTQPPSGARLREQVRSGGVASEGVASLPSHLSGGAGLGRQGPAPPPRRLRFEDESDMEVEWRYRERQQQRRWAGPRGAGPRGAAALGPKPDMSLYLHPPAVARRGQQAGRAGGGGAAHRGGPGSGGREPLDQGPPAPPEDSGRSLNKRRLNLQTEPLRETHIGCFTPADRGGEGGGARPAPHMQVRRTASEPELNGTQDTVPQATPTTDLPTNPYTASRPAPPFLPSANQSASSQHLSSALVTSQGQMPNGHKARDNQNQNHGVQWRPRASTELRPESQWSQRGAPMEGGGRNTKDQPSSGRSSESTAEEPAASGSPAQQNPAPGPAQQNPAPGPAQQNPAPGPAQQRPAPSPAEAPQPQRLGRRDEPARLSLRRLLSSVRLGRTRSQSLDRLSRPVSAAPPGVPVPGAVLRKSPSSQSLCVGSPPPQLKKSSSVQSFGSDQRKNRCEDYRPADLFLPRALSVEDVSRPYSARSVGRVLQVCADGTFVLQLNRPADRTFGFIISRGRGRPDSGVYVEEMVDSCTEKLYAGLLAVGDEILEVNGEKVACLSLDQVTHQLIQNSCATVRVLQQRRASPR